MSARTLPPPLDSATREQILAEVARLAPRRATVRHPGRAEDWATAELVTLEDLRAMAGLQDLFFKHHFASHRPVIGPLVVLAKRVAVTVLNALLRIVLVRQVELNQHVWSLALTVHQLEQRLRRLEAAAGTGPREAP